MKYIKKMLILLFLFTSGVVSAENVSAGISPDEVMEQADEAFSQMYLLKAEDLYKQAETGYLAEGDQKKAQRAETSWLNCTVILSEYPYNRTQAYEKLVSILDDSNVTSFGITNSTFNTYLSDNSTEQIKIDDGEIRYGYNVDSNFIEGNLTLLQSLLKKANFNPRDQNPGKYFFSHSDNSRSQKPEEIRYEGIATLNLSRDLFVNSQKLRIWIPTPIETDTQTNVSVVITPSEWVVKSPDTHGDLGIAYLEVPINPGRENVVINSTFAFTSNERRNQINPDRVAEYNLTDPEYIRYTASGPMILVTPEISKLAQNIVGDETNPYLQAQLIYRYIIENIHYHIVQSDTNEILQIPESEYGFRNRYGDCGTQNLLFAALCRSLGIPARVTGGMVLFDDRGVEHVWAEILIPGYGWIPVDPTMGQASMVWINETPENKTQFSEYFFGNQDPYRYYLEKSENIPIFPDPGDYLYFHSFQQRPIIISNNSLTQEDYLPNWTVNITRAEKNGSLR